MKRPSPRWIATPLAACFALSLGGCGTLGKNDSAPSAGAAAAETENAATPGENPEPGNDKKKDSKEEKAEAPPASGKPEVKKEATATVDGQKQEASKKETPAEPTPEAAAAEDFKGLPKGEAEFLLACRGLGAGGKETMTGKDGFVFDTRELGALGTTAKTGTARHQAMVATIKAYAEKLRAAGVELIIAPVPAKPFVYPDFLGNDPPLKDRRYDSYLQALYAELEKAGVRVADTTKTLRSNRFDKYGASFPKAGLIWSPAAAATSARAIHTKVRKTEAAKTIARDKTIVSRDSALTQNGETFKARSVGWAQGDRLVPATVATTGAPIVVIGDEHAPAHRSDGINASLADQLSLAFGAPVDTRATAGLGWKQASEAWNPAEGAPTKLVVWCFSAAQFLEAPAIVAKKPSRPAARRNTRSADLPAPRPATDSGSALQLRDDPGLEGRPE